MGRFGNSPNFADCLTVGEAAEYLGVSTATLRNWDRTGKLKPRRHPQNGYRIYLHEDLEAVLRSASLAEKGEGSPSPHIDWSTMGESEHVVQFYENDEFLVEAASGFIREALSKGDAGIVVAKPDHRLAIQRQLVASGINVAEAIESGRYIVLDAADTLAKLFVNGALDQRRFDEMVTSMVDLLAAGHRRVHGFGEMVAILWNEGNRDAAIRLEEMWSEVARQYSFSLFCSYPISGFEHSDDCESLERICGCHSRVIPAESYNAINSDDDRLRAITRLQQKAQSLEAEIEHRTEVERALAKRESELADFFENAADAIHKVDADGTILWANKAEFAMLGYEPNEYIGCSITEFHLDADVIEDILCKLKSGEAIINCPARLRSKDGSTKHVLISSNGRVENGQFGYTRCVTRDVTKQWQAEQALHEADRRKDAFLATLAHELRNPLAPIKNAVEVLLLDDSISESANEARRVIDRQVTQLTRLVDDLLDVSRITSDKIDLQKEHVDLASIIESAIETSKPLIDSAGHTLTVVRPAPGVAIDADPLRMSQVFANLLNNAAKYTEPGGHIEFKAEQIGREAVVSVRDNGVGVTGEALKFVFDMFRQADNSLERSHGGLGIGLTLVRRLVELHGGTVSAESDGPGKGSQFTVRLPVAKTAARSPKLAQPVAQATVAEQRILVVDDNEDSGNTLSLLLRIKGHEVRTARNGLEAIDIASEFLPKFILMDVGMPKLNGYDATRRLRQLPCGKEAFIVALTGLGQADDLQRSADAGCSAHLVKPVDFAELDALLACAGR